ncbi:hypothetical protein KAMIYU_88 [Mycobacterium phage Kamiyu]|uniref:Uncharacterized protein n=5 Tax=Pipefishvirus TaxID=1982899 RepID=X2KSH7_9CAUD|nr:hypothetical protein PHAEDRUS_83 [Mycobacterium phage Phaedrus]YP_002564186.1 gp88 [Mycobacterium phage Phlyer]YP_009018598.1 hypothetical protein CM10_gp088 [Mycobacterium phage Akoma]YP_009604476.1 hypothetical protein FDH90_gp090 [Mycobacterium phage Athena]YP_010103879.1 hypothetical protein KNU70_gp090 [Mycobacterium phage Obutu]AEJ94757.1 hypothetical protein DAISY_87 [Mycobacterium phage Daisy]AER50219.1 hypothetical protein KAMIYU_88 [Mycobacterium phage Kamiyu]AHN83996.1 hypothet
MAAITIPEPSVIRDAVIAYGVMDANDIDGVAQLAADAMVNDRYGDVTLDSAVSDAYDEWFDL